LFQLLKLFDATIQAMAMKQLKTTIHTSRPMLQAKKDKDKIRNAHSRIVRERRGFPSSLTAA
jgi:hypothetical protein